MTDLTGSDDKPLLLVVATGMRTYREYLFKSIATGFRIHLFHTAEPSWEQEYLQGWTVLPSTLDGEAMAKAARTVNERNRIDGVLCWDEGRILATSYISQALGLRNGDPAVVWRLRDKAQTRAALADAGVLQPRSVPVKTLDEALAAAEKVGYPAILKPRGLGASLGVVSVRDPAELREMFAFTRDTPAPDPVIYASDENVLVEHRIEGEEISVDSVVADGVVTPVFIARKVVGYPPYAEEIGHYVDAADPLLTDPALTEAAQQTHAALGFRDGWTHTEFMLTSAGPQLIEVNGRLGGDMIPFLGMLATGIDPGLAAARVACGLVPELSAKYQKVAGIRFYYPEKDDTIVKTVSFDPARLPAAIERTAPVAAPGSVVSPPPKGTLFGRVAIAIATGDTADVCRDALDAAESALIVEPESSS